jgi:ribonuclease PH
MKRTDGRDFLQLRPLEIKTGVSRFAEGSATVILGSTVVFITATVDQKVPPFLRGTGQGWITAEYSMLPRSTQERTSRDQGRSGRSHEIQRLIGRAMRACVDLRELGERTIILDCDVMQADGGTRTAAITGGWVALVEALRWLKSMGLLSILPLAEQVAAVSVGIVHDKLLLDLTFEEDSSAQVDLNLAMTDKGKIVEVQGTGEGRSFTREELEQLIEMGWMGIQEIFKVQKNALNLR